ncbi:MAG: cell division protein FtsZ [Candidatus Syntrophoarchaeum caldarius]|uniref:Cell division protein FtsZ n=1 Tax=Candidatus Syntropharchaeum caldarium TaxID=1838285 RepID=A0A1F2PBQ5_9EURY|nr:MAG: cell division protein FtsZ [Candidatus Syntrophoarchaeum caldarius]
MSFDSVVENASKYDAKVNTISNQELEMFGAPRIMVIGCGGAGNNTINRLYDIGIDGAEAIAINTDKQHLDMIRAHKKVLVGKTLTRGLGAGGFPEVGRKAAEIARGTLEELLADVDMVFITAGMGGGTGTGTAPIVAEVAKERGAIVVGMVSTPFNAERARRGKAEEGLEELRRSADTVIVLDNNHLLKYVPNLPIRKAFSVMDQLIAETVKGITETITQPSMINLDFADIKAVMNYGGVASMLVGEARQSQDRVDTVVRNALTHPLLEVDYRGATGSIVHITGGPDLTLTEANEIVEALTFELDGNANVIWGARIDPACEGMVKVMAIMTGVESSQILGPEKEKRERAFVPRIQNTIEVGIPKIC